MDPPGEAAGDVRVFNIVRIITISGLEDRRPAGNVVAHFQGPE